MSPAHISLDDLFQILSFYSRLQLFKFYFVNRLFLHLLEKHFATKPFANAILRIWTEKVEEEAEDKLTPPCRIFAGIAILDDFVGNEKMYQEISGMTKFTRKWQWHLDKENKKIDLNDLEGLQKCQRIVQFFQNGNYMKWHNLHEDDQQNNDTAYWTYNEEEACFVHKIETFEEKSAEFVVKHLPEYAIRLRTKRKNIKLREHLIANDFTPTWQCPLSAKLPLLTNVDGAIGEINELQSFLNAHLNSQGYIRLLSIEVPSPSDQPAAAWRVYNNEMNNIMKIMPPQIYVQNEGDKLPTTISMQPNVCNHVHIMLPESMIVKYEDGTNPKELIQLIYQQSSLDCAAQIQLPSAYLEKKSYADVNQKFLHNIFQQLLQDFLQPKRPCCPRTPFICVFLIHPDFLLSDILYPMANLNLTEFKSQHQFRRINYDADDEEHFVSLEDISPAIQRLIIDEEWYSEDFYYDSPFGYAFYDSNTKDHWRLHWTQLSANLCEIKICQFNADRNASFYAEFNNGLTIDIDRYKKWSELEDALPHPKGDYFDRLEPFLGSQNNMLQIEVPLIVNEHTPRDLVNLCLKFGLPDPPLDVQARAGPQHGTLLISWRLNSSQVSLFFRHYLHIHHKSQPKYPHSSTFSRAPVHGYLIYANGYSNYIAQVPGSTADHVLLRMFADFDDEPPVFIAVRAWTKEGTMSEYSNRIRVEPDLIPINQGTSNGRWFVAIQDNRARIGDPPAEELTFRRHQLVKVYGDVEVDENGYFWAEIRGRYGLVPVGKLVELEIDKDDMLLAAEKGMEEVEEPGELQQPQSLGAPAGQLMVAKYDYDGRQLSPNGDAEQVELNFRQGDFITIYGSMDEDGFYLGELNGIRSLVPSNFLQPTTATASSAIQDQEPSTSMLRSINRGTRNGESRWFVAIQDNQARIGDPPAEELTFRRHQLVKVYGDVEVDENGYFWAEIRGRYGLVPAGKLVEIVKDDMLSEMEDEEEEGQK